MFISYLCPYTKIVVLFKFWFPLLNTRYITCVLHEFDYNVIFLIYLYEVANFIGLL